VFGNKQKEIVQYSSIMPKEDEEPSESSPKRQRREEPLAAAAASESAASESAAVLAEASESAAASPEQQPETQSGGDNDTNKNKAPASSSSSHPHPHPSVPLQTPKLFIGRLHRNVTETHVEKLMMPYGSIVKVHLVLQPSGGGGGSSGPNSNSSRGFAFCEYQTVEQAAAAVAALDGRPLLGRRLLVRPAYEKDDRPTAIGMATGGSGGGGNGNGTKASTSGVSKEKEQRNLETKIQALKRKIQEKQAKAR
jgi:cold-inducible RNA-binding protein